MKIIIDHLTAGAARAEGITVIIDVFRAMTVECYLINGGASCLYTTADKDLAYVYRQKHPETILIGERNGIRLPGFDFGNSPSQIRDVDFTGKTVIHTTSAGTQGIDRAIHAEEILTGAFVNAQAISDYILKKAPETVSLVCMGLNAKEPTEEDTLCAEYIRSLLLGNPIRPGEQFGHIRNTSGSKFFDPLNANIFPKEDFFLSLEVDRFPFVLRAEKTLGGMKRIIKCM